MAVIDSREYAWKDLKLGLGGRVVTGVREVTIKVSQELYLIYASGTKAHSKTHGNIEVSGQIELLQSEVEALIDAAQDLYGKGATPLDLTLNLTMGFARSVTDKMRFHGVYSLSFTDLEMGMKQGDSNMNVTLPFKAIDVAFNI